MLIRLARLYEFEAQAKAGTQEERRPLRNLQAITALQQLHGKRSIPHIIDEAVTPARALGSGGGLGKLPGKWRVVVVGSLCGREFAEQTDEIGAGVDAVGLAGFDERIEVGTGARAGKRESKALSVQFHRQY